MDPAMIGAIVLTALVALDLAALRYGRDSRRPFDPRRNWW